MKKTSILCLLILLTSSIALAEETSPKKVAGFVDANYTYDTRDMNRLTQDIFLSFPYGLSYFTFINLESPMNGDNFNIQNFYSEQNIRWNPYEPLPVDIAVQLQIQSVFGDQARFGLRWRISDTPWLDKFFKKINLVLSTQFHPLQTDFKDSPGWGVSLEHVWYMNVLPTLLDNRVYILGFMDHNLDYGGATAGNNHAIVTETQAGVRIIGGLNVISEFRYSQYDIEDLGVAFGLEYKVNF